MSRRDTLGGSVHPCMPSSLSRLLACTSSTFGAFGAQWGPEWGLWASNNGGSRSSSGSGSDRTHGVGGNLALLLSEPVPAVSTQIVTLA